MIYSLCVIRVIHATRWSGVYALSYQATESSCLPCHTETNSSNMWPAGRAHISNDGHFCLCGQSFSHDEYKWPPAEQQGPTVVYFDGWTASRENVIPKFVRWELRGGHAWSTYSTFASLPPTYATLLCLWSVLSGQTTLVLWGLGLGKPC